MNINTTFSIIETQGTAYECGQQYGRAAASLIRENIDTYYQLIHYRANLDRQAALEKAEMFIPVIEAYNPDLVAEMRGVAEGAGVSLVEIVMLNCRTEMLSTVPLQECTAISAMPPATSGNVFLAQNWDWLTATYSSVLVLKTQQPDKPAITMLVEAGQIGKMGMNDAGLGLCLNWLQADHQRIGMPVLLLCREILNSAHIDTALNAVYQCKRASAANFLITYAGGFAIDLETTPNDVDFLEPKDGLLIHTNHFITPRFRVIDEGLRDGGGSSLVRRQRAEILLAATSETDEDTISQVLEDVTCGPLSCYMSPRTDKPELEQSFTLARILMNLSAGEMQISDRYTAIGTNA